MPLKNLQRGLDECNIDLKLPLVLGFSGGPDSLVLLHTLVSSGYSVIAAHLDHGLRTESIQDAQRAGKIAAEFSVPLLTERVDAGAYAKSEGLSIEEAARELRYRFLFRVAHKESAQAVAVAHNADDQVETVLMHLLRGAGGAGLRGMAPSLLPNPWSQESPLVRPMLKVWRNEILEYCQENNLQPIQDPSNIDTTYFRNRLRHELLPLLEDFSPGFKTRLHHSAELLAADHVLLEKLGEQAWQRCLAWRGDDFLAFGRNTFMTEPLALQRSLLRRAVAELRPTQRDLTFETVDRVLSDLKEPSPAPQDWLAGLCVFSEQDRIWIADWQAVLPVDWPQAPAQAQHLEIPAHLELNSGWRLNVEEGKDGRQLAETNRDQYETWLDLSEVGEELILRRRQPGDRFQPLGMGSGSLKLSDFMINEKMPQRARAAWPLLCKGEEIVWVPGYRLAHPYRLRPESTRILHIQMIKN